MYSFGLANFDMISSGTPGEGISEQRVKELINQNNNTVVQNQIQNAVSQSASEIQTQMDTAINQATSDMQSQMDTAINQATSDMQSHVQTVVDQATSDMQGHVQTVVDQATSDMQTHVADAVADAADDYDDTKIYATYDDMLAAEPTGREDVLYIITDEDNTRYVWNGSAYTAIEGRIDKTQIETLFNQING